MYKNGKVHENLIQYPYARDKDYNVISIDTVTKGQDEYFCLGCNEPMLPILPQGKVRKHFRHLNSQCNYETYLHKAGVVLFYNTYKKALENNKQFLLKMTHDEECEYLKDIIGSTCSSVVIKNHDLTKIYKNVSMEIKDKNSHYDGRRQFKPDIMISNFKNLEERVYVEIYVTHKSEDKKIDSGVKIIEIYLNSIEDLKSLSKRLIDTTNKKVELYNFNPKTVVKNCLGECSSKFHTEYIDNGKHSLKQLLPSEINRMYNKKNALNIRFHSSVHHLSDMNYINIVQDAHFSLGLVIDCHTCIHSKEIGKKEKYIVFCSKKWTKVKPVVARECKDFIPISKEQLVVKNNTHEKELKNFIAKSKKRSRAEKLTDSLVQVMQNFKNDNSLENFTRLVIAHDNLLLNATTESEAYISAEKTIRDNIYRFGDKVMKNVTSNCCNYLSQIFICIKFEHLVFYPTKEECEEESKIVNADGYGNKLLCHEDFFFKCQACGELVDLSDASEV